VVLHLTHSAGHRGCMDTAHRRVSAAGVRLFGKFVTISVFRFRLSGREVWINVLGIEVTYTNEMLEFNLFWWRLYQFVYNLCDRVSVAVCQGAY
jgi:hypothetical protein